MSSAGTWSEDDSRTFIDLGQVYTPARDEIQAAILDLMPVAAEEPFLAVELGVGGGWLSEGILARYPHARIIGLDASPTMLAETAQRLHQFPARFDLRAFRLEDPSWLTDITEPVRCFVSSLVIHHLDGPGKRRLYSDLFTKLASPGAVLIADVIAPSSEWQRRYIATAWDAEVERQSIAFTGSDAAFRQFQDDHWNIFTYPDPMDIPTPIPDHLAWLTAAGFTSADVFWSRAGHAFYGAYKEANRPAEPD